MSNKENRIFNESGAQYPFNVPEGYFDNLTARIMDSIPEEKQVAAPIIDLKPRNKSNTNWVKILSIAASFALVVVLSTKMMNSTSKVEQDNSIAQIDERSEEDAYNEDLVLYSMVDNSDIYDYLSGYDN